MRTNFELFGPVHLLILCAIPALAGALAVVARRSRESARGLRRVFAALLVINTILWYGYLGMNGWLKFPDTMPLELCDATLAVTLLALLTLRPLAVDLAYYGAFAGATMALLTPDLWEPFPSFGTVQFFIAHGLVVASVLYLVWSREARPRPGSVWRAMLGVNVFAAAVGLFNAIYGTNYMYLRAKPPNPSLLDFMGPWPWYLLTGELVALALFSLLWLPFARQRRLAREHAALT